MWTLTIGFLVLPLAVNETPVGARGVSPLLWVCYLYFFLWQSTAYEVRISDWSSDVCSSDLDSRQIAKLGRADRREVLEVREEHAPAVADPVMKADFALGGLRREIRRRAADGKCHAATPHESPRPPGREDAAPAGAH